MLSPLFSIMVDVGAPLDLGDAGGGVRRCVPILGGTFSGAFSGEVLPGADWQNVLKDGTLDIAAHYALRAEGGGLIEVESKGLRAGPPDVLAALARGEAIEPARYYFRTAMRFRTGAPALQRLNTLLAIAKGERRKSQVLLEVFEVL